MPQTKRKAGKYTGQEAWNEDDPNVKFAFLLDKNPRPALLHKYKYGERVGDVELPDEKPISPTKEATEEALKRVHKKNKSLYKRGAY